MASSLFPQQPQNNPIQAAMAAARQLSNANPDEIMHQMMQSNPQFAAFVEQNRGKSPDQIAQEHGLDLTAIKSMFK